jgi:hypothetical protein
MNLRQFLLPIVYKIHKSIFSSVYFSFIKLLEPSAFNSFKKSFGRLGDGSYVLPLDLLSDEFVLLSFGVADDISFEEDFLLSFPKTDIYTFDPSISNLPCTNHNIYFDMVGLSGKTDKNRNLVTLDFIISQKNIKNRQIILKMDIEGWEWEVIYRNKFKDYDIPIIVAEFHVMTINTINEFLFFPIHFYKRYKAFQRLKDDYYIYHIHANNYNYSIFPEFVFPWCFEITFIKKTLFLDQFKNEISSVNSVNCPDRTDYQFPFVR